MTQQTQAPIDLKRLHAELLRDPEYSKSRNALLWVSVCCCVLLAMIGLMVMYDRLSIDMAAIGIGGSVIVYFYFMIRVVGKRNAAEARWVQGQAIKREKKKERKKNR